MIAAMQPATGRIQVVRLSSPAEQRAELARDVRTGLSAPRKSLPPKYFYDARGSQLFERITELPEYYLTRTETALLERHAQAILAEARPDELVEIGSGSSRKTRLLLEALLENGGRRYVPIDVSEDALRGAAGELTDLYPELEVHGVVGDFERHLGLLPRDGRRL